MDSKTKAIALPKKKGWDIGISYLSITILVMKLLVTGFIGYYLVTGIVKNEIHCDSTFFLFILAGFIAQMIAGALGMAYGVSCTSFLLSMGVPARLASASVHTSEIFTTGVSGLSHIRFKNIDKELFFKIVITGVIGASLGAYLLSDIFDGNIIKPYISIYLLFLGLYIFS